MTLMLLVVCQVLVLTHEKATVEEAMPYFAYRMRPCKANLVFGRAAAEAPPCEPKEAVFHWYRDSRVPWPMLLFSLIFALSRPM